MPYRCDRAVGVFSMNRFWVHLLAGAAFVLAPAAVSAQETITINGAEAKRVVIAPPQTGLALTIKAGLKQAYRAQRPGTRAYTDAQKLYFLYGARHFEPFWITEDADGEVVFSANAEKIIAVFEQAHLTGLRPEDYLTAAIDLKTAGNTPADLARLETAFSEAALRYAQDTYGGRIDPRTVSGFISLRERRLDDAEVLEQLAATDSPDQYLLSLEPQHREFQQLKTALAGFYDGTVEEAIVVPDGKILRAGERDERLPLLRDRLEIPAPAADLDPLTYDQTTVAAVEAFQERLGLTVDGIVGPATIAALNGGSATQKVDVIANMERWRWMPEDMGQFMVHVNIPEFRVAVMRDGTPIHSTRVVVGTVKNKTPVFSDEMEHIVVNPYWNVPSSIARNEIGPQVAANPGYIARNNMELLYGGRIVDAAAVDWSENSMSDFRIRQRPGAGNALGSVKFLFPNRHNVYLHDTPSKYLFSRSHRAFSHGCVRVQNPWEFAAAILQGEPKIQLASLESQRGGSERWNNLERRIPVHITYFTLRVDPDGTIRSYGDVYGHNQRLIDMMGLE